MWTSDGWTPCLEAVESVLCPSNQTISCQPVGNLIRENTSFGEPCGTQTEDTETDFSPKAAKVKKTLNTESGCFYPDPFPHTLTVTGVETLHGRANKLARFRTRSCSESSRKS